MKFVCLSDTHNYYENFNIPNGDVLLFAGDMCNRDHIMELKEFNLFLEDLPHKHKIIIAGNHDFLFHRKLLRSIQTVND